MAETNKKQFITGAITAFVIILLAVGGISCRISDVKWQKATAAFEQKVPETLSIYGASVRKCSVNKQYVSIYVNSERWNNTSKANQKAFMEEVVSLIQVDAATTGITDYTTVWISFHETNSGLVGDYTLKKRD